MMMEEFLYYVNKHKSLNMNLINTQFEYRIYFIYLQFFKTGINSINRNLQNNLTKFNNIQMSQDSLLRIHNISQQYKIIQKVGRGTYGTVYKAKHLKTGQFVAIKKIQNKDVKLQSQGFPITALRQINLLKKMNHKNIIKMKEIIISKPQKKNLFRGTTFLIFQYMDHDFAGLFKHSIKFTLPQIKCLIYQILEGVKYLSDSKILHRDIKSANLLLNSKGEVKIADFGLGRMVRPDLHYTSKVVTLWYRAPELLLGTKHYNSKVDIWSVGCVMAQFFIGEVLFKKQTQYSQIQKIYEVVGGIQENNFNQAKNYNHYNDFKPKNPYPRQLKEYLKKFNDKMDDLTLQFLSGLLELNPKNRLSVQQALNHRFFTEGVLPCKISQIPKFNMEYHQMFKQPKPYIRMQKVEQKTNQQYKKPPSKYFQNERKYSYQNKQYKKQYQKNESSLKQKNYLSNQKDHIQKQFTTKQKERDVIKEKEVIKQSDTKKEYNRYDNSEYNPYFKRNYVKNSYKDNTYIKDNRDYRDYRDNRDYKDAYNRDDRDNRDYKDRINNDDNRVNRDYRYSRDQNYVAENRDYGKNRDNREYKDSHDTRYTRQNNDYRDTKNVSKQRSKQYVMKQGQRGAYNREFKDYSSKDYTRDLRDFQKEEKYYKHYEKNEFTYKYDRYQDNNFTNRYNKLYDKGENNYNKNIKDNDDKQFRFRDKESGKYQRDKKNYNINKYNKDISKSRSSRRSHTRSQSNSKSRSRSYSSSRSRSRQNQNFSYSWKNTNNK